MNAVDALRAEVATRHGLGREAAALLAGETVDQLEQSAVALAHFVDAHKGDAELAAEPDPITAALAGKAEHKRQLAATILGRRSQSHDERGRFAPRGSFDGGAREPLPAPRDPQRDHDELVAQMVRLRRIFGGSSDF
jgi:hypothetical protein